MTTFYSPKHSFLKSTLFIIIVINGSCYYLGGHRHQSGPYELISASASGDSYNQWLLMYNYEYQLIYLLYPL